MNNQDKWNIEITSSSNTFNLNFKEVWAYRDLLQLFIKRDLITVYKQTVLGPLWYIIQPILTTLTFSLVFGKIAKLPTDGLPPILFYLLGITVWNYFAECIHKTSNTFVSNQNVFGKVYFPRLTVPLSIVISTMVKFGLQFLVFTGIWIFYFLKGSVSLNITLMLLPFSIFLLALMSLGFGMLFSSLTTKYRDLQFLISFSIQLWMYATPIIYPLSSIPEHYLQYLSLNPITPIIELFRYSLLGKGIFQWDSLVYSGLFSFLIFFMGAFIFSKVEKNFMDTV